jgi:sulfatase maturation enzyme AslB (radical SAM superfamily)
MSNNQKGDEVRIVNGKFESRYLLDSEQIFNKLNEVSGSFCLAKWFNVSLHIPTGRTHSCYHPPAHPIPLQEVAVDVSTLHNTSWKKIQRKDMLEGKRPTECSFCWQIEDSGDNLSDRAYRSKDVYTEGIIEEALEIGWQGDAKPRYVEVNFNQACNFRCTYCSPHLSTAWMQDIEKNGAFILEDRWHNDMAWMKNQNMIPNNSLDNPYLLAFWKWLPDIYPTLQTFRMTGGEPLMDKNTFRMFDYVKQNPHPSLQLSITSNCNPPGDQWSKFMTSLKQITDADAVDHFMLFCSLDSWGEQAEYIRNGMDFATLYNNITDFLANGNKHSLTFIVTFNALSYSGWCQYIEEIHKLRERFNTDRQLIWFDIPMLTSPDWLNPKMLPEYVSELEKSIKYMNNNKETAFNRFKGFKDFEISKVQRLIDWIKNTDGFDKNLHMKNFYLYFKEHDKRRGTDFLKTFPDLENFWHQCKELING